MHVFFIQYDPDIDYIVPIAYKLASKDKNITIISINPLHEINSDYRLKFLRNYSCVRILYLHQINSKLLIFFKIFLGFISALSNIKVDRFYAFIVKFFLTGKVLENFLINNNVVSVTIDEGIPKHALKIINCAKSIGIPTIMIPNGGLMFKESLNALIDGRIFDTDLAVDYRIVAPNKDLSKYSKEIRKPLYMGVTRYCKEWQEINSKLISNLSDSFKLPTEKDKLKVLVFSSPRAGLTIDNEFVKKIANDIGVSFIFKNKPRGVQDNPGIFDSYPSALLVQWADVVIGSVSNIVLDIFYYKKQFIFTSYLSNDRVGKLKNLDACKVAKDEKEIINYLSDLKTSIKDHSYSFSNIKEYYENIVYVSDNNLDVLGDYYNFYTNLNRQNKIYKIHRHY
jgi:hypothetical protein